MKEYFAKYLPVEEEIKKGDKAFNGGEISIVEENDGTFITFEDDPGSHRVNNCKKVKLFLCNKDVGIGDKIYTSNHNALLGECNYFYNNILRFKEGGDFIFDDSLFKIIGEISPDALNYVKEGDEFDPDHEVMPIVAERMTNFESAMDWTQVERENYIQYYKVKGPCGHFH